MTIVKKVGFLHSGIKSNHGEHFAAFLRGLADAGYIGDGSDVDHFNVEIVDRWANDDRKDLRKKAKELVQVPVNAIVAAGGSASAVAARAATKDIPIVFTTVADPVASGLVKSLDYPGRNLTGTAGLTSELDATRLALLHELCPESAGKKIKIGVLTNSSRPSFDAQWKELKDAAARLDLTLEAYDAPTPSNGSTDTKLIRQAFKHFKGRPVLVTADPFFNNNRKTVVDAALDNKTIAIYQWREFVAAGGLMSYGPKIMEAYCQAGNYVGRILDGDNPKNLPVVLPKSFELVINLRTADKLRLKIPGSLLARADLLRRQ
jgi:putative tryptophan/tyrosine transport system substrate-binding protein